MLCLCPGLPASQLQTPQLIDSTVVLPVYQSAEFEGYYRPNSTRAQRLRFRQARAVHACVWPGGSQAQAQQLSRGPSSQPTSSRF
jgi:hypothetical protein